MSILARSADSGFYPVRIFLSYSLDSDTTKGTGERRRENYAKIHPSTLYSGDNPPIKPALEVPTVLDTVVVSATRSEQVSVPTPASISVITAQDIERSGARNVTELLRGRAGIQVSDLYGDGSGGAVFDMRGFGATAGSNT